jgi:hypothetical protein
MLEVFAEGNHIFRGYTKVADEVVEILENIGIPLKESFTSLHSRVNLVLDRDPLLVMSVRLTFDGSESVLMLARLLCAPDAVVLLMLSSTTENLLAEIEFSLPFPLARTNGHGLKLCVHGLSQGRLHWDLIHFV